MDALWRSAFDGKEWGATMKRTALTIGILGFLATQALAGDGVVAPASPYNGVSPAYSCTPWGAIVPAPRPMIVHRPMAKQAYPDMGSCDSCGAIGDRGNCLERLMGFLFFRPTIPCDWCPKPTPWEPPLYARFPNVCHATMGGCAEPCTRRWMMGTCQGGCATCAASLGRPLSATTNMMARQGISTPYSPVMPESGSVSMRSSPSRAPTNLQANARYPQPNLLPAMFQQQSPPSYSQPINQPLPQRP